MAFRRGRGGARQMYVVSTHPTSFPPPRRPPPPRRNLAGGPRADYLVVLPEAWLDVASTLADFRRSQGYSVLVAPLESVNDEFNGGSAVGSTPIGGFPSHRCSGRPGGRGSPWRVSP